MADYREGERVMALRSLGYNGRVSQGDKGTVVKGTSFSRSYVYVKFDKGTEVECPNNSIMKA